ncbi:13887_t:CDS:2 [Gigaspora rosea]|nr:13887_t:CDS:2 [Gigaspora rosea]
MIRFILEEIRRFECSQFSDVHPIERKGSEIVVYDYYGLRFLKLILDIKES